MKLYKKLIKKHIHKTAKSKPTSNKLKEEVCFILKMHYLSEQKKVNKQSISCQTKDKRKRREGGDHFQRVAVFT